ncbi:MAG: outer membrane beta-barrel protein [Chitinophagaceae bacterium]|nr:outer membrane beta-barrel protein [Saprospiraceae bacterium]MBP9104380.1 outer membrane beta-barrel protein [Chitinophagaceae bacterium]
MKNAILIYCLIVSVSNAQEQNSLFNLIVRPSVGLDKLILKGDGGNPSIPTNSSLGLNLSISSLIEYNRYSKLKIYTGVGFKFNQLHTTISNIITGETLRKGWKPIEISETYNISYLTFPLLFHYNLNKYLNIGFGISYDYLISTTIDKVVSNNTDPEIEKITNKLYPGKYSFFLFYKHIINSHFSILPTVMISSNKTTSEINSKSTGPSLGAGIQLEVKI